MNIERDKFLVDTIAGQGAWDGLLWKNRPDFSTWEGFGKLWEWAQRQEWCNTFWHKQCDQYTTFDWDEYIHPDRFADAVYEFLKGFRKVK